MDVLSRADAPEELASEAGVDGDVDPSPVRRRLLDNLVEPSEAVVDSLGDIPDIASARASRDDDVSCVSETMSGANRSTHSCIERGAPIARQNVDRASDGETEVFEERSEVAKAPNSFAVRLIVDTLSVCRSGARKLHQIKMLS